VSYQLVKQKINTFRVFSLPSAFYNLHVQGAGLKLVINKLIQRKKRENLHIQYKNKGKKFIFSCYRSDESKCVRV